MAEKEPINSEDYNPFPAKKTSVEFRKIFEESKGKYFSLKQLENHVLFDILDTVRLRRQAQGRKVTPVLLSRISQVNSSLKRYEKRNPIKADRAHVSETYWIQRYYGETPGLKGSPATLLSKSYNIESDSSGGTASQYLSAETRLLADIRAIRDQSSKRAKR